MPSVVIPTPPFPAAAILICIAQVTLAAEPAATCVAIEDPAARLRCYDAAHGRNADPTPTPTPAPAPAWAPAPRAATPPAAAPDPDPTDFGLRKTRDQIEGGSLQGLVSALRTDPYGRFIVELDNGQVWQQIESARMPALRAGANVVIRHGALSSYRLSVAEAPELWIRVKRLR